MATIDHQAWLDALKQVQASTNAYGFDPSWFCARPTCADLRRQTGADEAGLPRSKPGARDWSPGSKMRLPACGPDTFGGLVMTPEGAKAYDDLVTKKGQARAVAEPPDDCRACCTPVRGRVIHGSSCWGGRWWCSSLAGIAPELTAPCPLPVVTSQPPKSPWAAFLALGLLEALGRLARVVSERSAGWGLRPRHFLQCCPGADRTFVYGRQFGGGFSACDGWRPNRLVWRYTSSPSVGGPVASIPEHIPSGWRSPDAGGCWRPW